MNTQIFYDLGLLEKRDVFYPLYSDENRVSVAIKNFKMFVPEITLDKLLIKRNNLNYTRIHYVLYPPDTNGGSGHSTVESFFSFNKNVFNRRKGEVVKFELIDNDLVIHFLQTPTSNLRVYEMLVVIELLDCPNVLKLKDKTFTLSNSSGNYHLLGNHSLTSAKVYNTPNNYSIGFSINSERNGIYLTKSDNSEFFIQETLSKNFIITINN